MRIESPTAAPCDVQIFNAPGGTWEMPPGASSVHVVLLGGGGMGGLALDGTLGNFIPGGGGGGGGGWATALMPAVGLPAEVTVTVGIGGSLASGGPGGVSTFGDILLAYGGGTGNATPDFQGSGRTFGSMIRPEEGGRYGDVGSSGSGYSCNQVYGGCPGGGGGGSILTDGTLGWGGSGQPSLVVPISYADSSGVAPGGVGGDGEDSPGVFLPGPGVSGGGGAADSAGSGGSGGSGGLYGSGGGGGGATVTGFTPGSGGDGAPGICVVTTYF